MVNVGKLLRSKMILLALAALLVFLGQLHLAQWQREREIDKLIAALTEQEQQLGQKNQQISDSLEYLQSPDFKERTAREQLELKREGEVVVRFQDQPQVLGAETASPEEPRGNLEKWLAYYFKQ